MYYITVKQSPSYRQMSIDELLFNPNPRNVVINEVKGGTRTYEVDTISERFMNKVNIDRLILRLISFNDNTQSLRERERKELYSSFKIPKRSGGLRQIDAPVPELMEALRNLKSIFENDFGALYHTSAYAYVKKRCTVDSVKRHQENNSRWFAKFDLTNFFGSTTKDFVMKMFSMVFPFSEVIKNPMGKAEFEKAIDLAFLNGGLPQGTPISPIITNVMMIPIDFTLARDFREFEDKRYVYTRYADDFLVSSRTDFDFKKVEKHIKDVLASFEAPFTVKESKTRYGSSAGANWNLGVMLNKDNEITVGHKKKKQFQTMLAAYVMDKQRGKEWNKNDIQTLDGYRNYYKMVEGDTIDKIVDHVGKKFGVNIPKLIKADLKK